MKQTTPAQSRPTARCKAFAALLPVLDLAGGEANAVEEARAHLADCAFCQAEYAAYRQIDSALHRHLSPPATPRYNTEELVKDVLAWPETLAETRPAAAREVIAPLPAPERERAQRPANKRQFAAGLAALAAVVILALVAFQAYHAGLLRSGTGGANDVKFSSGMLQSVSMVSPTEGWAVGGTTSFSEVGKKPGKPETAQVLLWHYLHGRWSAVNLPLVGTLSSISMDSPTDGWATGYTPGIGNGPQTSLLLHYNGHIWQQMPLNPQMKYLGRVIMLSPTDGWIVGSLLWHYDGHTWTPQMLPDISGQLPGDALLGMGNLSMLSPTDGWALGGVLDKNGNHGTVVLHYTGGQWSVRKVFMGLGGNLLTMVSDTEGWMSGYTTSPTPNEAGSEVLLHYIDGQWKDVTSSFKDINQIGPFYRISMRTASNGWLIAPYPTLYESNSVSVPTLFHYDGTRWNEVSLPTIPNTKTWIIYDITMVSATEGWAVGSHELKNIPDGYGGLAKPLILHYLNGTWSIASM